MGYRLQLSGLRPRRLADLFVANYVRSRSGKTPKPGQNPNCFWKGIPVMCGPRGLPLGHNVLYRNQRDGTFADVSEPAGILKTWRALHGLGGGVASRLRQRRLDGHLCILRVIGNPEPALQKPWQRGF